MKNRKKVAFILNKLMMGGAENMVIEQIRFLDRNRFEPYLITIFPNSKVKLLTEFPKNFKYVPFIFHSIFDVSNFYKLVHFLRHEKVDAVITNLFDANLVGRVAAILAGVPVILSYEHNIYEDKKQWQIIADRILAHFTKKILVGSNEVMEFTSKQEHLPKSKFQLNFNSIPFKLREVKKKRDETLLKYEFPQDNLYIVTAGSLTAQKAHSYLIDAIYQIKQKNLTGFKVLIFGKGKLNDDLTIQIKKLNLGKEIKLMGIAPISDIMAMADIFTLPSLWEGLSLALLEAMDAICPIVATKVSGTNEALEDEVSALLVEPGNSVELAEALSRVLKYENLRQKLASNAKKAVERFSIEKNVKVIENLIWP